MVLLHPCSAAVAESAAISKISRIIGAFSIYKFGVLELGASGWVISPWIIHGDFSCFVSQSFLAEY